MYLSVFWREKWPFIGKFTSILLQTTLATPLNCNASLQPLRWRRWGFSFYIQNPSFFFPTPGAEQSGVLISMEPVQMHFLSGVAEGLKIWGCTYVVRQGLFREHVKFLPLHAPRKTERCTPSSATLVSTLWDWCCRQRQCGCQAMHSMAIANLNKSEELVTNTTAASKNMPKRPRICINGNPPFQTSLHEFFKNCFLFTYLFFFLVHPPAFIHF